MTGKRLLNILCLLTVCGAVCRAGIAVHADKFVIAPGETREVTLEMDCDSAEYRGFQLDVTLPAGLVAVKKDSAMNSPFVIDTARVGAQHKIAVCELEPGHYRMVGYSSTNAKLGGTSGALLRFEVKAEKEAFDDEAIGVSAIGFATEANVTEHAADAAVKTVYANPLGRVVADGTDGHEYAVADTLAIGGYTAKGYAFVTNGKGGWLKVNLTYGGLKDFVDMQTIEPGTLVGTMTDGGVNPTLTPTFAPQASREPVDVEMRTVRLGDLGSRRFDAAPNEVLRVVGVYVESAEGRRLCQYEQTSKEKGVKLDVAMDWCNNSGDLVDGSPYSLPVVAQIREPWTADSGHVADADRYSENYIVYPLEVPVVTETGRVDAAAAVRVAGQQGRVLVLGAAGAEVTIFDVSGRKVAAGHGSAFALPRGVYAVLVDGKVYKVAVR